MHSNANTRSSKTLCLHSKTTCNDSRAGATNFALQDSKHSHKSCKPAPSTTGTLRYAFGKNHGHSRRSARLQFDRISTRSCHCLVQSTFTLNGAYGYPRPASRLSRPLGNENQSFRFRTQVALRVFSTLPDLDLQQKSVLAGGEVK